MNKVRLKIINTFSKLIKSMSAFRENGNPFTLTSKSVSAETGLSWCEKEPTNSIYFFFYIPGNILSLDADISSPFLFSSLP
jgi:hypothetical protein